MRLATLEDLDSAITHALQLEDDTKWYTGDVVCAAIECGLHLQLGGVRKLEQHIAQRTGRGWRTIHRRRVVSATFALPHRNERLAWETHTRIAELARSDDSIDALAWLAVAADNEMTADQVEAAIRAAHGDAARGERIYLLRAAQAQVMACSGRRVVLELDRDAGVSAGIAVVVTMAVDGDVQGTAQESEDD